MTEKATPVRPASLPPEEIMDWVERDPDGYYAAVRDAAADLVDREVARRTEPVDVWLRRAAWVIGVVIALWAAVGLAWLAWAVLA